MILYLDTSALVKKYVKEPGSSKVISAWKKALGIATSAVTYAEMLAAFHRKSREERIDPSVMEDLVAAFLKDWKSLIIVEVNDKLNELLPPLIDRHALRGFDAIHLASALILNSAVTDSFLFACYDERLLAAARAEALETLP
jgi:predicted nucleic acid-binding protein